LPPACEPPFDDEPPDPFETPLIPEPPPLRDPLPLIPELLPPREPVLFDEPPLIDPPCEPLDEPDLFELLLFILFAITSANPLWFL